MLSFKCNLISNNNGLTLIEIVLVVGFLALLLVFSIPEFLETNRRQVLKSTVTDIIDTVNQTQNLALGGVQSESEFIARYRFEFAQQPGDPADYYRGYQIKQIKESGEEFSPLLSSKEVACPMCIYSTLNKLDFMVPTAQVVNLGSNQTSFLVCHPDLGQYEVSVDIGGRVYRSDFQSTSCACPISC